MMTANTAMILTLIVPLIGAVAIGLLGRWPNIREAATMITAVTLFALVIRVLLGLNDNEYIYVEWLTLFSGVAIAFNTEPLSIVFAMIASGLWIVTSIYAIGYMRGAKEKHQTRFYVCFAIALSAAMGVAFSANLLTLFIFYEVLTLSTYPLVTHKGDAKARSGGRTYLGILMTTSIVLLLPAIIWVYATTGTLDFVPGGILAGNVPPAAGAVMLMLFMFGVAKAALMPFHRWLPAAMVAPTPVSALLHAVAVVKAGVFTVLKVSVYIFGPDYLDELVTTDLMLYIATFTVLAASLVALTKDNLKSRLAYSTVSQLSYIVVAAMLVSQTAVIGGGLHIVMHAFGKITLFFCAGAIYVASKKTEISDMDGIGRQMPFTLAAFGIGALSVIGLPPAGGSWSKLQLMIGAMETGHLLVLGALAISTLLNIAYLMPLVVRGFLFAPKEESASGIREAPLFCVVPLCLTAAGCIVLFFLADPIVTLLEGIQ